MHLHKILIPTDFSEHSQRAMDYAVELAKQSDAQLHLLHVTGSTTGDGQAETIRMRWDQLGTSLDEAAELGTKLVKHVTPGEPYNAITDYARAQQVDLIVMGTHGRTGLSHFALGSVAERVVRTSACPVLVMGPRRELEATTLQRAVGCMRSEFGQELEAGRTDGIERMRLLLREQLALSTEESAKVIEQLERMECLRFSDGEPGTWQVTECVKLARDRNPETLLTSEPESQALELIQRAQRLRATDIHLDPGVNNEIMVRFRIDSKLEEYCRLSKQVGEHLQNQLKMLADLNLAEPFRPQEGRLNLPSTMGELEVRITTARVAAGDAVALRLFDGKNIFLPLSNLGLSDAGLNAVNDMLHVGEGLVLVTGPTGSGKSTTVYSMLESLGGIDRNVVSVEDPVEFVVPFVRQMNVDEKHGVSMTSGLRTILRMDPDVVFLGEIRDVEAAQIAMRAASSGKYVLSTLHTRDVASTITALRDMDIGDRSAAGNLTGIINQRLLRRLCPSCKRAVPPTEEQMAHFAAAGIVVPAEVFSPVGCSICRETGYRGRIGVFEVALMNEKLANAVATGVSEHELKEVLRSAGVESLMADVMHKAALGITSVEEALGVHWLC